MKSYTHISNIQKQKSCVMGRHYRLSHPYGFSLIELMVSVALFTIVMTVSVGTLTTLINANQKAQSLTAVMDNLNFALDSMSRTIRTERFYYCTDSIPSTLPSGVLDCPNGATGLLFTDDVGGRFAYRYNSTTKGIEQRTNAGTVWLPLTAPEAIIDEMLFYVTGTTAGDLVQPTVTISLRGHAGPKESTDSYFNLQTTVTQRVLDE